MEQKKSLKRIRKTALGMSLGAIAMLLLLNMVPDLGFSIVKRNSSESLVFHTLIELFAIVISIILVVHCWNASKRQGASSVYVLIAGFSIIAITDLAHTLSYEGMPDLITPNSVAKGIFFWLSGRLFEIIVLSLVALKVVLPGGRLVWLCVGIGFGLIWSWVGVFHYMEFPTTHIPGKGVTAFKAQFEVVLFVLNIILATYFLYLSISEKENQERNVYIAASCFIMGIGELAFTSYYDAKDSIVVLGHVFKIMAYGLIYRAMYLENVINTYDRIIEGEARLVKSRGQFKDVLDALPVGVLQQDKQGNIVFKNELMDTFFTIENGEEKGFNIKDFKAAQVWKRLKELALEGHGQVGKVDTKQDGYVRELNVSIVPQKNETQEVVGTLAVVMDVTEQQSLERQLASSTAEIRDLRMAIDAHAILAITDRRGVILSVNEKFCEISGYSKEELVGKTHSIINSGYHPEGFFREFWKTISEGKVWRGDICNRAKSGDIYWVETTIFPILNSFGKPERFLAIRADITERKKTELKLEKLPYQDELTGLPNRRMFMEVARQKSILKAGTDGVIAGGILIDIDGFKKINDAYGHDKGDEVLIVQARRLQKIVEKEHSIFRMGSDEFLLLTGPLGKNESEASEKVMEIVKKVKKELEASCHLKGSRKLDISVSMGVLLYQDGMLTAEDILKKCDLALDRGVSNYGGVHFFNEKEQQLFDQEVQMEMQLRKGLIKEEFEVFYQKVVDKDGSVVGFEALIRWRHEKQLRSPATFIPLAEKTGIILQLGDWIFEQVLKQLKVWSADEQKSKWMIAVNLSVKQFEDFYFLTKMNTLYEQFGLDICKRVKIEITESSFIENLEEAVYKLSRVKEMGFCVAIDDFGTGYSSLNYLRELPVDTLKIDQSFIKKMMENEKDKKVVNTIIHLGVDLGVDIIAEGVETAQQWEELKKMQCPYFQGYYFAKPVPIDQLDV